MRVLWWVCYAGYEDSRVGLYQHSNVVTVVPRALLARIHLPYIEVGCAYPATLYPAPVGVTSHRVGLCFFYGRRRCRAALYPPCVCTTPPHPLRRGGDSCVSVCLCMDGTLVQMWWKTWDSRPGWGWSGGVVEWRGWVYSGCGRVGTFGAAPLRSAKEDKSPSPRWFESFSATEGVDVLLAAWMQVRCPVRGDCRMTTPQRTRWSCPSPLRSSLVGVFGYPAST
jgi:hypothetical protein